MHRINWLDYLRAIMGIITGYVGIKFFYHLLYPWLPLDKLSVQTPRAAIMAGVVLGLVFSFLYSLTFALGARKHSTKPFWYFFGLAAAVSLFDLLPTANRWYQLISLGAASVIYLMIRDLRREYGRF